MSSKVKQANFRLPLEYMALIDDFARREDITKATVITRALDCMQASYDSRTEAAEEEVERLRALVAKQAATLEEKIRALASKEVGYDDQARTLANKDAEISSRDAIIADRDRQITDLRSQLSEAQARVQLSNANSMSLSPVTFDASTFTEESPVGAISMLNMLNGVMAAFKQQVKDARILGEQEGRKAQ